MSDSFGKVFDAVAESLSENLSEKKQMKMKRKKLELTMVLGQFYVALVDKASNPFSISLARISAIAAVADQLNWSFDEARLIAESFIAEAAKAADEQVGG